WPATRTEARRTGDLWRDESDALVASREGHAEGRALSGLRHELEAGIEELAETLDDRQADALARRGRSGHLTGPRVEHGGRLDVRGGIARLLRLLFRELRL